MSLAAYGLAATSESLTPEQQEGQAAYLRAIDSLDRSVAQYQEFRKLVSELEQRGINTQLIEARTITWVDGINKLFSMLYDIIVKNVLVQESIDFVAGAMSKAKAYVGLGEVPLTPQHGTWKSVALMLKPNAQGHAVALGLGELANPALARLGIVVVEALANPQLWAKLLPLLRSIVTAAGFAFTSNAVYKTANVISGNNVERGDQLIECLRSARELTNPTAVESAIAACDRSANAPKGDWNWLLVGLFGGAAALLYYQKKHGGTP